MKVTDEDLEGLPYAERWLLVLMATLCDSKTGTHFWSQKRIAAKAGMSLSKLKRTLNTLQKSGHITITSGKEQSSSNLYRVNLEPVIRQKAREAYANGETYPKPKTFEEKMTDRTWADKGFALEGDGE
ncbi:helix-turn-helix domain-containing protein [Sansalvadorimonas verongulae]|uniref:helix-turn-helix domain-containing protein n=1 Tax=Sansalvadorimonas verongulae TaxID=2172824 RepID=UPI0012BC6775|nr:helix-turn-helix domain-containing protein [Sansalvadorimonas verongulae]MTI13191.1 hypothetical protein [Sansalvadorimonas verongulae]